LNNEGEDSSDSEGEEEEEDMDEEQLYWMAQGPCSLPGNLHHMPKHPEKFLPKFDLDKKMKVEDKFHDF